MARGWGVYVFAVADVDAYVVCAVAPEYEVTWLKGYHGDWGGYGLLVVADAWEADACLCEDVLYEAAAVEACWCAATPYIWDAKVLQCVVDDLSADGVVWHVDRWLWFWLFWLWGRGGVWCDGVDVRHGDVRLWLCFRLWCWYLIGL